MSVSGQIKEAAEALGVPFLVHFTRVENLPSIIKHGLVPVSDLSSRGIEAVRNDELRLDGRLGGISASIAFPNAQMFYKLRNEAPDVEWCVLALSQSVMWEKKVLFCRHNAADARVSALNDIELADAAAFSKMFEEVEGLVSRDEQHLKPYDPTDVQAEVLILERVEPELIRGVVFPSEALKAEHQQLLGQRKALVHSPPKGFFANRTYFRQYG